MIVLIINFNSDNIQQLTKNRLFRIANQFIDRDLRKTYYMYFGNKYVSLCLTCEFFSRMYIYGYNKNLSSSYWLGLNKKLALTNLLKTHTLF